ncbi:hypothetical protein VE04_05751 [Pseudogymnoascus sp. 24MN13]|nr:hypothetical protein VE04_05751 [Pseudogymnoascus sp. 24MN13]
MAAKVTVTPKQQGNLSEKDVKAMFDKTVYSKIAGNDDHSWTVSFENNEYLKFAMTCVKSDAGRDWFRAYW